MTDTVDAELVDDNEPGALVPHVGTADVTTYRPELVLTPEQASKQAEQIREIQRAVLREGADYGVIPGTNKPSLYKPGAEWLLKFFGFGHEFDEHPEIDREDGKKAGVTYRARVTKLLPDGKVVTVATCDGYAGYDEDRYWEKPYCDCPWRSGRGKGKDHRSDCPREDSANKPGWKRAPWNTVIKMAQKRALVGATLQATGTSGLFTQDVEDYGKTEPAPAQSSPRQPPARGEQPPQPQPGRSEPSAPMIRKLQVSLRELGIDDDAKKTLYAKYGESVTSSKQMTRSQVSALIDMCKDAPERVKKAAGIAE